MARILRTSILILWLQLGWVSGQQKNKSDQQQVKQAPQSLTVREGEISTLNCTYENSAFDYFIWYRQYPGKGPKLLLATLLVESTKEDGRFTISLNVSAKQFSLDITAPQPGDSATYFCAAGRRGSTGKLIFGQGTTLRVKPDITDPDPAVYQLKSPKSSKTSVCLFTDFDSEKKMPQSQEGTVIMSNGTVLDMRVMDSKSNGVLAWSNSTDFKCNSTFNEKFYSSSDFSCNATLIEKSFETDMNLNAHNLLVMGLRVLLLKVAGFNLFVTLRLWSR